jgi:hypothetical protein
MLMLVLVGAARLPLTFLPLRAVELTLLEWYRAAELSADRASALACRDPLAVCRSQMALAGGLPSRRLDLDAFLVQASEYEEWDSAWDKVLRLLAQQRHTHPFSVRRVAALMQWVREGEYDRILGGHYPRRGERDVRGDADAAYAYYSERFRRTMRDAGSTADATRSRTADLLG